MRIGIFASLDRSLLIKFFPTPIRVRGQVKLQLACATLGIVISHSQSNFFDPQATGKVVAR